MNRSLDYFRGVVAEAPSKSNGWLWSIKDPAGWTLRTPGNWSVGDVGVGKPVEYLQVRMGNVRSHCFLRLADPGSKHVELGSSGVYECRVIEVPSAENFDSFLLEARDGRRFRIPQSFVDALPSTGSWGRLKCSDPERDPTPWTYSPWEAATERPPPAPDGLSGHWPSPVWTGYRWISSFDGLRRGLLRLEEVGILVEEYRLPAPRYGSGRPELFKSGVHQVWVLDGSVVVSVKEDGPSRLLFFETVEAARRALHERQAERDEMDSLTERAYGRSVHELILEDLGRSEADQLVRKAVWTLRREPQSEHSPYRELGFNTLWDDLAWQVQKSHGPHWEYDLHEVRKVVAGLLEGMSEASVEVLWLVSARGEEWWSQEGMELHGPEARTAMPWIRDDLVDWLSQQVLMEADGEDNPRLRAARDMGYGA